VRMTSHDRTSFLGHQLGLRAGKFYSLYFLVSEVEARF
jgi:hypothetical protein